MEAKFTGDSSVAEQIADAKQEAIDAAVEAAATKIEALLGETIVDQAAWLNADAELEKALVDAGVIEDESPSAIEKVLTSVLRTINRTVNKIYAAF